MPQKGVNDDMFRGEVDDLLKLDAGLSAWEIEFIESFDQRLEDNRPSTDRQVAKLHQLWELMCG